MRASGRADVVDEVIEPAAARAHAAASPQPGIARRLWEAHSGDIIIACGLGILASAFTLAAIERFHETWPDDDVWFGADIPRLIANLTDLGSDQSRVAVHPLSPLFYAAANVPLRAVGLNDDEIVRTAMALVSAAWVAAVYAVGRLLRLPQPDAIVLTVFAGSTGAATFFLTVPETYGLGALTLLVAFGVLALSERRPVPEWVWIGTSVLTFAITITNWLLGVLAAFWSLRWRRALQVSVNAFAAVTILWGAQQAIVPDATFFLSSRTESQYVAIENDDHVSAAVTSLLVHTVVAPRIAIADADSAVQTQTFTPGVVVTAQNEPPRWRPWWGLGATVLWLALLAAALTAAAKEWRRRSVQVALLFLAGQLGLHAVYGAETFLYSLNFLAGLLVLIAVATRRWRRPMLVLVAVTAIAAGAVNVTELDRTSGLVSRSDGRAASVDE